MEKHKKLFMDISSRKMKHFSEWNKRLIASPEPEEKKKYHKQDEESHG